MSHHFQILSLCERKNLRDLCRESNPGPLNYMSRAHYLYHWIRDLDLASSFLKQPKMRDLGVHFPKIFPGEAPGPPVFSQPLAALPQPPHLKTSSYASGSNVRGALTPDHYQLLRPAIPDNPTNPFCCVWNAHVCLYVQAGAQGCCRMTIVVRVMIFPKLSCV